VGPEIEKPNKDIRVYWNEWYQKDGFPFWPFWEKVKSWWEIQNLPNVMFIHFSDLKKDMPSEIRKIATFLEIEINYENWPSILEYCSFEWMKHNATKSVPLAGAAWDGGAKIFINKG
jgi:aryl sulfotransferase